MSTTVGPHSDRRTDEATDALDLFDDLLFENPEICSRCYARIRDKDTHDLNRLGNNNRVTETLQRAGRGTVGQRVIDKDRYGSKKDYDTRTFCADCGAQSGRAYGSLTASLQTLRRRVDAIARRLHEQGYYPDLDTLYATAITLKRKPSHQRRDRQILAAAVYLALRDGDEATCPGRPSVTEPPPERAP